MTQPRRPRPARPLRFLALCLVLLALAAFVPVEAAAKPRTHYAVLDLEQDASLKDIKKAYRRLAVQHHPDRNLGNEEEATVKFREISEAYEVLSDEDSRREYDRALKGGYAHGNGGGGGGGNGFHWSFGGEGGGGGRGRQRRRHRDPFAQFNDVFKNDPFFADAARNMDDLFDKHFGGGGGGKRGGARGGRGRGGGGGAEVEEDGGGGIFGFFKDRMPNVNVKTSFSSNFGGSSSYSTSYSSSSSSSSYSSSNRRGRSGSTYTSRSTRTTIENGRRVTIQTLEKDGNRIEEKYVGEELIERRINGKVAGLIDDGGDEF